MTEQLVFELAAPEPPSFGNFLPGRNAEVVAALTALAALDRHSLATKRPITVPMLRDWLQREIRLDR